MTNAGTIIGTVDVGYYKQFDGTPGRGFGSATFVAAGGTVSGDVLFGESSDLFVQTSDTTGIAGIVDGGRGKDTHAHLRDVDATVSLDPNPSIINFEDVAVQATTAGATVIVTASAAHAGDLFVGGAGKVVNQAMITGAVYTPTNYNPYETGQTLMSSMAALENRGTITGGVAGTIGSFTNSGTVTALSGDPYTGPFYGVQLYAAGITSLTNSGTIAGGAYGAVGMFGDGGSTVLNTGTITGEVWFSDYATAGDRFENRGTMAGLVWMGTGDDVFVQVAGARLEAAIGGAGNDLFVMQADANGSLAANQVYGFERLMQTRTQAITYLGALAVPTIELAGGTLMVATGGALGTTGPVAVTGGDAGVTVVNRGRIAGGVQLGSGNDTYFEGTGSSVRFVDGGAGRDTYGVLLSGDRQGIGARSGFERLAVEGPGTLSLTPDQDFTEVTLAGANLALASSTFSIGAITGSNLVEQVVLAGDVASVALGGGDDMLTLSVAAPTGRYDGGAGTDLLRLTNPGTTVLRGSVAGFETVAVSAGTLTVAGTLGRAGETVALAGDVRQLALADGGAIDGTVDLGAGDSLFTMSAGGVLAGTVAGGAGMDVARFDLARSTTLSGMLTGFEVLQTRGLGGLTLARNAYAFTSVDVAGELAIAGDASLAASQVRLATTGSRLTLGGRFSGSVSGNGGGTVVVSGGSQAAPVAFAAIDGLTSLQIAGGWSTVAGRAGVSAITLTGGRLTGLAGSTIVADRIAVGRGALFGSTGTVQANVVVDGTLSPGASPGTMTVLGNVSLAPTSLTLFEIAPGQSDRLAIDGRLTIASGATLELVATQRILPGQSLDLITTTRGIDGSFANVVKSAGLFGFVVQDADSITLLGQFMDDPAFDPQVRGTIAYVNDLLTSGRAGAGLLAAAPLLVDARGGTNRSAFAQIAPQAYATASQISVEQGLELARLGRSGVLAAPSDDVAGPYTFASVLGRTGELGGAAGVANARLDGHGVLGGIGWGNAGLSLGAFVGWSDNRQTLRSLGARTDADGVIAGVHARWRSLGGIGVTATIAYDGANATTTRTVLADDVTGGYDLRTWTGDIAVDYAVPLAGGWTLRPSVGATFIRTRQDGTAESGSSALALTVAERRQDWTFVDGTVDLRGGQGAGLRPWLTAGIRYRVDGAGPRALAGLPGGALALAADGAARDAATGILALGADVMLARGVTLFGAANGEAGKDVSQGAAQAGLRVAF
ncbi:hypothetical protein PK98_01845 [Croceibacterium mercuriale]|uniref:Autotransporter domain-containing protein n=1 Tax=Croceibacterium mercuriale TaxID=1572751 RepID=A0A0B2BVJ4_9SPHN|nr:autotransporter outer membrane beta-barrel domain-containing protein [Croceibacterium mercuriale]KHL25464.1 hypothetical protein PK98_01845 [Croceibacterium mercuriale]